MNATDLFIKEYQERFEKKLKENEITLLEHWKAQLDKVTGMQIMGIPLGEAAVGGAAQRGACGPLTAAPTRT